MFRSGDIYGCCFYGFLTEEEKLVYNLEEVAINYVYMRKWEKVIEISKEVDGLCKEHNIDLSNKFREYMKRVNDEKYNLIKNYVKSDL
jgi:hypothetical protein